MNLKRFLFLIFILGVSSCSKELSPILSDLESNNLKGAIMEIEVLEFDKKGSLQKSNYDKYGFLYLNEFFNNDSLQYSEQIIRDSNHLTLRINTIIQDSIYKYRVYHYDENRVIKIEQIINSSVHTTWDYKWGDEGSITQETITKANSNQRLITYSYPNSLIEITKIFNEPGELFQEIKTEKDTNNSTTKTLITTYYSPEISSQFQIINEMDILGNIIKMTQNGTEAPKKTNTFMYEYDSLNNWSIQYVYENDIFMGINERVFKYY